jgi:hypothetical protein
MIVPEPIVAGGSGRRRGIAFASVLFPQPVSPTIPTTRPGRIFSETFETAWKLPAPTV